MINNINFNFLKKKFTTSNNITIISHINPDGDAIGSSLGMLLYLKQIKQNIRLILPNDYTSFLKWLPGTKEIIIFSKKNKKFIENWIKNSDYIFLLDINNISRILPIDISYNKGIKIMIDHHIDHPINFDFMFLDYKAPSTSILIFKFIENMEHIHYIDKNIATCLYTGIITDTGFFQYQSVTYQTHIIVSKLIKKGINVGKINSNLSNRYTYNSLLLLGQTLNKSKLLSKYRTTYMSISFNDLQKYNCKISDTEGFVNYGLKINNIIFSILFIEDKNKNIKISFRSKGTFDVNLFAKKYFQGGGHKNAAGAQSHQDLINVIKYFLKIIPKYEIELNNVIL